MRKFLPGLFILSLLLVPALAQDAEIQDLIDDLSDRDAYAMARRLATVEGVLVGSSGGLAVVGALWVAAEEPDALVVVILADSGRSYVSKVFNDDWMTEHGLLEQ